MQNEEGCTRRTVWLRCKYEYEYMPPVGHEQEGGNRRNKYGPPPPQKKKEASLTNIPAHYNGNAAMRM